MAIKNTIISFWKQVKLKSSDMFTLFRVGIGVKVPTNKLHIKDATDPLKIEGLQNDATDPDKYLSIDSSNIVKYRTGAQLASDIEVSIDDLHGAGVDGAATQLLTDNGDGTVTSEADLLWDNSTLTIGNDDATTHIIKRADRTGTAGGGRLYMQGGKAVGVNQTGGGVGIYAGAGTGTGHSGNIDFNTATGDAGSGSVVNGTSSTSYFSGEDGSLNLSGKLKIAGNVIEDNDGIDCITFDSSGNTTIAGTTSGTFSGNLTGNASGTAATVTSGTQAAITTCANLTTVGTIGTGTWNADVIPSAKLDADTAHLTTVQTFSGQKTFSEKITQAGDRTITPGDAGVALHVDGSDITDGSTSASGTASTYMHVSFENPRVLATNASVTTTNAATVYIKGAPLAHTNQTFTNAYALWVAGGNVRLGSDLEVAGDITVIGNDIKDSGGNSIISSNGSGVVTMPGGNINIDGSNSNFNFNNGSDIVLGADVAGGTTSSIAYLDSGSVNRYMLMAEATDKVVLCNRASNGTVQIRANTSTAGSGGEITVVTVHDDKVDISKDLNVTGVIAGKQRHIMNCGFNVSSSGKKYFPFGYGGLTETGGTTNYGEYIAFTAPCDGYLDYCVLRTEGTPGSTTMALHLASDGTEVPSTTATHTTAAIDMSTDDISTKFSFGRVDGAFTAGQVIVIGANFSSACYDTWCTAVLIFDWNNEIS